MATTYRIVTADKVLGLEKLVNELAEEGYSAVNMVALAPGQEGFSVLMEKEAKPKKKYRVAGEVL